MDLVAYLEQLGYQPQKIRSEDYWYLSPLRPETVPSFKVNRYLQVWYDHGLGQGGDIIDFGTAYFRCTVSEFLQKLSGQVNLPRRPLPPFSFHQPSDAGEKKISIMSVQPLSDPRLLHYLAERHIALEIARYCKEVSFSLKGKAYKAIGLKNDAGSSPKDITFLDQGAAAVVVVEGLFDLLAYRCLFPEQKVNLLVLNTLAFSEKSPPILERHEQVQLCLDHNRAGREVTESMIKSTPRYHDASNLYQGYKDLNEWLMAVERKQQECLLPDRENNRNIGYHL
jgi:DNA primase